jgi:hypothetical protein
VNLREGTQINLVFRRSLERERDRNTNYTAGPQAEFSGFKKGYFKPFWAAWLRNFGRYVVRVQRVGRFIPVRELLRVNLVFQRCSNRINLVLPWEKIVFSSPSVGKTSLLAGKTSLCGRKARFSRMRAYAGSVQCKLIELNDLHAKDWVFSLSPK